MIHVHMFVLLVVNSNVLVLRVGGQTADVTIMAVNSGMYRVCDTVNAPDLGGSIIDDLLVEHFAAEFQRSVIVALNYYNELQEKAGITQITLPKF